MYHVIRFGRIDQTAFGRRGNRVENLNEPMMDVTSTNTSTGRQRDRTTDMRRRSRRQSPRLHGSLGMVCAGKNKSAV
jgi:hypothetical protein